MKSFSSRGTPGVLDVVRTLLAVASVVPSLLLGVPAALLSGSWRRAINVTITTWGELGIPLAPHDRARFERYQDKARTALAADAFEQARREGRSMTVDQALTFALAETG